MDFALDIFSEVSGYPLLKEALEFAGNVRDALFLGKVQRFIDEAGSVSEEERDRFLLNLEKAEKKEELGTALLLILDRADEIKKPLYVGRIMAAHIRGEIEYDTTLRLCYMISRCYAEDLKILAGFKDGVQGKNEFIADGLFAAGFLANGGIDEGVVGEDDSSGTIYNINEYGKLIVEYVLYKG